ncbi:MAG: YdcF family protein [Fluviicola sp.]|nr:YdcF family protein [Fluviicola sp.]
MFFILSKALLFLLSPFFWMAILIAIYYFSKNSRLKKRVKWSSIFIFFFFTNSVIFSEFTRLWEIPGQKISKVKKHDVAIVLGGMFEYNSDTQSLSIRRQGDRLIQAVSLYRSSKVDKILISGDSGYISDRGLHEARQVRDLLILWGIPETDIITEENSKNTHENAVETVRILKKSYPHFNKFILVTSGIHMKRSLACFKKEGLVCTPFSTDLYANQTHNYHWDQWFIPNFDNFRLWNKLNKEMVGYPAYWGMGYL